jgi:2'-5' RNA ligase
MPRLFVALELDAATRAQASERAASLRRDLPPAARLRWMRPESLHVTLAFLGSVDASRIEAIGEVLRDVASAHAPLEARVGGVGVFDRPERARVLWLGFGEGDARLFALVRALEDGLRAAGFALEARAWRGHVTLARAVDRAGVDVRGVLERDPAPSLRCPVDALVLMESRSSPQGAAYHPLLRAPLAAPVPLEPRTA